MVIHTYIEKSNTLIYNSNINTGLNPIAELFYGGDANSNRYSRHIFHFDETRLKSLYTGGTFTDLTKLKHTLRFTNTGSFDKDLLNGNMNGKNRTTSFDLILFKIDQEWDAGTGYDYEQSSITNVGNTFRVGVSNWAYAQTGINWSGGTGVYSGSPTSITITTQHFDYGNENIGMDVTDYINGVLTGDTNYGLGIAYSRPFEELLTQTLQYVGFFTNNTQTFYEPYIETIYSNNIKDDRDNFFLDKNNKLYLYTNLNGNPTNLDTIPSVNIFDENNNLFSAYTSSDITHVTKGVYSIDLYVPTTTTNKCTMYNDVWTGITINGVSRPDVILSFDLKDSNTYYNIGNNDSLPQKIALSVSGVNNKEKIKKGDIRKVIISTRIPYSVEQKAYVDDIKYRLYVAEGKAELTVIDFQPVEMTNNNYYFLLDTESLITNTYYLDVLVTSNLEINTFKNILQFDIVNQSDLRKSQ